MKIDEYLNESDLLGDGTCGFYRLSRGPFHYHRQVEIVYVEKGVVTVLTATKKLQLKKNQFAVIKPYELHTFDGTFYNKCVCPILPDVYSNKLSQLNFKSCVFDDVDEDVLNVCKMYSQFNKLTKESRLLYFNNIYTLIKSKKFLDNESKDKISEMIFDYIHKNFQSPISIDIIATACNTNRYYVSSAINKNTHMNFNSYVNRLRLSKFIDTFDPNNHKINDVINQVGFDSTRTFYRAFKQEYSMTPKEYFMLMNNIDI